MTPTSDETGQQDHISNSAATVPGHLDSWTWRTGELRDHLGHDHKVTIEAMVGLNRWALLDLHTEKHDG